MDNTSLTIGISAYNEEQNIGKLLRSIYFSDLTKLNLKKIIVISDSSADNTENIVRTFSTKLPIQLITNKIRKGKILNVQKIIDIFNTDLLILFDADVVLGSRKTLIELSKPFHSRKDIGLVGSNAQPVAPKTWVEAAVYSSFKAFDALRYEINSGHNVFSVKGCGLALSKDLAKKIHFPQNTFIEDAFLYFKCLELGYQFRFASKAVVKFRLPTNINDQIKQNRRYLSSPNLLEEYFGKSVASHYYLPKDLFFKHVIKQFVISPISTLSIFFINLLVKLSLLLNKQSKEAIWSSSLSTRKLTV
jgi:cellulose synthase/poly-beta-1,6-N-acetylglucosamine synthase-like glycosyltransferase